MITEVQTFGPILSKPTPSHRYSRFISRHFTLFLCSLINFGLNIFLCVLLHSPFVLDSL